MKIYSENKKQIFNITLSVKISQNDNSGIMNFLENLQKEIINCVPINSRIQTYVYPVNTIHFSLMNFSSFELDVDFEDARKIIELQNWYSDFVKYVNDEIIKILPKTAFTVEKFYKREDGSIKGSIALNIKNKDDKWRNTLKKIENEANKKLQEFKIPINNFGIKEPKGFFVINLLRFFGIDDDLVGESYDLQKLIEEKEANFPTSFEVENFVVVISNQYLSNKSPQIIPELL